MKSFALMQRLFNEQCELKENLKMKEGPLEIFFFHTGVRNVKKEPVIDSLEIKYRTQGGIFGGRLFSDEMMRHWIEDKPIQLM